MRAIMRIAVFTILINCWFVVCSLGQSSPPAGTSPSVGPESGVLCSGKYTNASLGFSFRLPKDADLKVFSSSAKGPALSHFLVSLSSANGKNRLVITAKDLGIGGKHEVQNEAAGPHELSTKQIQIGGNTFWRSESKTKSRDSELQSLTFATERKGYVLTFYIVSFEPKLTAQLEQSVQTLIFFDAVPPQEELDASCKAYNPSLQEPSSRIYRLSDGVVSNHAYYNTELGFHYQIPDGWTTYDHPKPEGVWFAESEYAARTQCVRNLLLATQYTASSIPLNRFNSYALLFAADPGCAPGVNFPGSVDDLEAIRRIARAINFGNFKTHVMNPTGPANVRTFKTAGRVMLDISQPFLVTPQNGATRDLRTSVLLMQAGDYWVIWVFVSDNDTTLQELRATKIVFNDTTVGSANP